MRARTFATDEVGNRDAENEARAVVATDPAAEPPQGENESFSAYFERVSRAIMGGRVAEGNSVDILRRERELRTAELERRVRS